MNKSNIRLAKILAYCGTLPLVASVLLIYAPVAGIDGSIIAITYAAIIISFLCGMHWAIFLFFAEKCPHNLLVTSNIVALLAWSSLLVPHRGIAFVFQALCFIFLFMLDFKLHNAEIVPEWFYNTRRNATAIVVLCLAAMAVLS